MVSKNENVSKAIQNLLEEFKTPGSLHKISKSMFTGRQLPQDQWSTLNRLICVMNGGTDVRNYMGWKSIERYVKAGEGFNIIAPVMIQKSQTDTNGNPIMENGKPKKKSVLVGFKSTPVWDIKATSGKAVEYPEVEKMPDFIGKDVAEKFGLTIQQGFENPNHYAFYSPGAKVIEMATPCQQTFFHELSHAADDKISGVKGGQDPVQEIVAEFSSAILMGMFGLIAGTKNSYDYIERYAKQMGKEPIDSVIPLISRISKIIDLIME